MYVLEKRKQFNTVEELIDILSELPGDARVCVCGMADAYCHVDDESLDGSVLVNLDDCDMDDIYKIIRRY